MYHSAMTTDSLTRAEARDLALELMATHGLIGAGWSFRFNRAKSYAGLTDLDLKEISLSGSMVDAVSPSSVRETILHEIAHALTGEDERAEHGPLWRAKALEIGSTGEEEEMVYIPQVFTSLVEEASSFRAVRNPPQLVT